jgi:hypothetical protein
VDWKSEKEVYQREQDTKNSSDHELFEDYTFKRMYIRMRQQGIDQQTGEKEAVKQQPGGNNAMVSIAALYQFEDRQGEQKP